MYPTLSQYEFSKDKQEAEITQSYINLGDS